jgi:serine/threonine-protein kinase
VLRSPHYSPSGHVVFERTTNNPGVWAIPFALATLESSGEPFLIAPLGSSPSVSRDGTLAFVPDMPAVPRELAWVSRNGTVEQTLGPPQIGMTEPALSPDGARVAVAAGPERSHEIWIHDLTRKTQTRLTFVEKDSRYPAWVPPGNRIIFDAPAPQSASSSSLPVARSIASYPADGAGALTTIAPVGRIPGVSPDGRYVMYMAPGTDATATALDLWYAKLDGDPDARVFESSAASQVEARFSPDGHLVAYVSNESGRPEVYVKPFPSGEGKWQVSSGGGRAPLWTRTGDRLVYWEPATNKIIETDVTTKPAVSFGTPRDVFTAEADLTRGWDISADGRRFLVVRDVGGTSSTARNISVVQNWFAEYRR